MWHRRQWHHSIHHSQKPHATRKVANFMAVCFTGVELLPIKVLYCGIKDFGPFSPVTLTLIRWPSYTNLTHIPWRYTRCANINFLWQGFWKLSSDRHTDTTEIIYHTASRVVKNLTSYHIVMQSDIARHINHIELNRLGFKTCLSKTKTKTKTKTLRFQDQDRDRDERVPRPRPRLVKTSLETSRDQDSSLENSKSGIKYYDSFHPPHCNQPNLWYFDVGSASFLPAFTPCFSL